MLNSLLLMMFIILSTLVLNDRLIASGAEIISNEQQSLFNTEKKYNKETTAQNEELISATSEEFNSTINNSTSSSLLQTMRPSSTLSYDIDKNDQQQELIESILTEKTILASNKEKVIHSQNELIVIPVISDESVNDCTECDLEYCLENIRYNKNCTKLIRDQCNCCTVCLRNINETCGGKLNIHGICDNGLDCESININNNVNNNINKRSMEQIGKCIKSM
ncbi:unnamed protein product [Didymodactylos carnosus]|uniref:IGFBP N-terminal domain-containing protein n=1 Tax=Didymodactylos carnosus TaxID=1234261 RepID=A0A815GNE0_9BILA|nr:unnamed protein product [Didymodactylos carnosus]CAF1340496.1 unnamed protein product [Didymodactylos carnosus]CAF3987150.1 unnamed protein product [Didymodactylos carnosus]CAF4201049.1 unnamed protein product [Didymodactylos carnosus]